MKLAGEHARAKDGHQSFFVAGQFDEIQLTGHHDEEFVSVGVGLSDGLATLNLTNSPVRSNSRLLRRREGGKHRVGCG